MDAVRVEGLRKRFGRVTALNGLSLSVESGSLFGFLGPNGAGKTTAIRILTGLAGADGGRAWLSGIEVGKGNGRTARLLGYLPQEPAFYPWMTAAEMLDHVARTFGLNAAERRRSTEELLGLCGLKEASRRRIGGFSGGMKQRLGIAQALVNRPAILLLDEPVSSLDPFGRKELLDLIDGLRGRCTVFMSTHILADVERICDTVGIIDRGRLIVQASKKALLETYAAPVFDIEADSDQEAAFRSWTESLARVPWMDSTVFPEKSTVRVLVNDPAAAKRELLASAVKAGLVLTRFETVKPTLEDVFIKLVSRAGD
ncbi:MAG: ABC transporter ATP-binding protein [Candidatus Aminicenantes bacterium]|nr:ABC transporter ATP-binding protein [Candidatus Aminicenantes bacterium]